MTMTRTSVYKKGMDRGRLGRGDRSWYATWFWEIDRVLLLLVALLIGIGLIAVAAASPAEASRHAHKAPLAYFFMQLVWVAIGVPAMIAVSMLPKDMARRYSLGAAAFFSLLLVFVPLIGFDVNGSVRWIGIGALRFQPSEFLKPFFTVALAWMLSLKVADRSLPILSLSGAMIAIIAFLLMKQPDFGQTVVFVAVWVALLILSGIGLRILAWLGGMAAGGVVLAYMFYENGRDRIDTFLGLKAADATDGPDHTELAFNTITHGGWVGMGPGSGVKKFSLPEAHNDYIFSVIGEEFGLVACMAIALIYCAIMVRVFIKLLDEEDSFLIFASAGLAIQFGLQAIINMMVNVHLAPSKGMTLPFISYGGSSIVAISLGFGLLLAFTRRNPYLKRSPYVVKWSGR
jgi:cell division protein FtsW